MCFHREVCVGASELMNPARPFDKKLGPLRASPSERLTWRTRWARAARWPIRLREEFPAVPRQIEQTGADALAFLGGPAVLGSNPKDTIAPAATTRLPAIFSFRRYAAAGGLLSFGASLGGLVRRLGKVRRQD